MMLLTGGVDVATNVLIFTEKLNLKSDAKVNCNNSVLEKTLEHASVTATNVYCRRFDTLSLTDNRISSR